MVLNRAFLVDRRSSGRPQAARPVALRAVFRTAARVRLAEAFHCRRHQHLEHEVVHVRRGRYHCRLNDRELRLTAGQILLVASGDWHEDFFQPPICLDTLHFRVETPWTGLHLRLIAPGIDPGLQVIRSPDPRLVSALCALQETAAEHRLQDAITAEVLWRLVHALAPMAVAQELQEGQPQEHFRRRLQEVVDRHVLRACSVTDLAAALDMSTSSLSAKCRRLLGCSPAEALLAIRIERAQAMLRFTDRSIHAVAEELGFADQFHFSKVFKRLVGVPPTRWRATSAGG